MSTGFKSSSNTIFHATELGAEKTTTVFAL